MACRFYLPRLALGRLLFYNRHFHPTLKELLCLTARSSF